MSTNASGRLYVAGNFNQVGGVGASHTAGWDGTNWFALGATTSQGMTHFLGQTVGLFHDGTNLYAGGVFTEAGGTIVNGTAVWNGTNWSALGPVVNGQQPTSQSRTFARIGSSLFAAGSFTNIGGSGGGQGGRNGMALRGIISAMPIPRSVHWCTTAPTSGQAAVSQILPEI